MCDTMDYTNHSMKYAFLTFFFYLLIFILCEGSLSNIEYQGLPNSANYEDMGTM